MATSLGRQAAPVIDRLFREPHRFDFFQAVRLLELAGCESGVRRPVGHDALPHLESLRFRAAPAHSFPAAAVREIHQSAGEKSPEVVVNSIGLTGPNGVLPDHYTALVIERLRLNDPTLSDFLDIFNHRTISLYYRAWQKSKVSAAYEQSRRITGTTDPFTQCLYSLVGRGNPGSRHRMSIDDEAMLQYGGFFTNRVVNGASLKSMLGDYFQVTADVVQFWGQWLQLSKTDRSRLTSDSFDQTACNRLGQNAIVGERVWDVQGMFRIRLGPLTLSRFEEFMPDGRQLPQLWDLTRSYVGPEYDFDIQLLLYRSDVPPCTLSFDNRASARLGWNTWLWSESFTSADGDGIGEAVSDVVFGESATVVSSN